MPTVARVPPQGGRVEECKLIDNCGLRFTHHGLEVELEVAYYPKKVPALMFL